MLAKNGETVRRMALAGVELARLADFHIAADLAVGPLVEVLADGGARDAEAVHALHLGTQRMPRRVRALLDFMVPRLAASRATGGRDVRGGAAAAGQGDAGRRRCAVLASSVNIGAFNLGNAVGAAGGGGVLHLGYGYAAIPVPGAAVALIGLALVGLGRRPAPARTVTQ